MQGNFIIFLNFQDMRILKKLEKPSHIIIRDIDVSESNIMILLSNGLAEVYNIYSKEETGPFLSFQIAYHSP